MHLQGSTQNWLEAAKKLPADFNIKAVDQANLIRDARAVNLRLPRGTLRHWGPGQRHEGDWETRKQRARAYFATFVDGTFRTQYAQHIGVVQFYNEIWANSQSPEERASWTEQERAAAVVWNEEYRSQPDYAHIRLALSSAAVGNDLPKAVAQLAIAEDCYLAYHPYIAVYKPNALASAAAAHDFPQHRGQFHHHQPEHAPDTSLYQVDAGAALLAMAATAVAPGERSEGDWRWASGRWHFMEQQWGLKPDWLFTEGGPCRDVSGSLRLDPLGGWRAIWGNGGADGMLACLADWFDDVRGTPAFAERRIGGVHLFTTPGQSPWGTFAYEMPELERVAELIAVKWQPVAPPLPPPPEPEPRRYARTYHLLPQDVRPDEVSAVIDEAYGPKQTVGFSVDDAFVDAEELTKRTVHVWDVARIVNLPDPERELEKWVEAFYPPLPEILYRRVADLFVADRWDAPVGTEEERAGDLWPGEWFDANPFLNHYSLGYHTGVDLNNNSVVWDYDRNMPVYAAASGRVTYAGMPNNAWQRVVVMEHRAPDGTRSYSRYAHLGDIVVSEGQWLRRGQMLGIVGRNMTDDGPGPFHLHFDVSHTTALLANPGHWPGENRQGVVDNYREPKAWIEARR